MKDLKESYPVELASYATGQKIDDEPAFAWWVPYVLKQAEYGYSKRSSPSIGLVHTSMGYVCQKT
jgi:hypothetical protein